jgi:hypothetical protein
MIEDGELDKRVARRYAGWNGELGQQILKGQMNLADIAQYATQHNLAPQHQSGHQELLENVVNRYLLIANDARRVRAWVNRCFIRVIKERLYVYRD